ncbi:growth-regulating factor 4-like [Phalaenopsis equestris]|uniref:growth-regulating factor 4-like n=1 Tax=Phalaenopsis equestris TaxID=78828 RepID=UPI0009E193DB|nr:growth-regulating factor 4-like [Phalaenopsis equestris]XP_020574036.1 growth-regulating factor 4-like [Phalaenopsis equestris]
MNSTAAAVGLGCRPPFTASQWEELEHQALIFKYLIAGIPVPPELLLPIRRSFETMATRFYQHPALGYCSYYGKKLDPEPGRCRRTDGKKWRCSKDAYPDSKYCERHMHRGRNRSRKHVETPPALSQSQSCSTVTSLAPTSLGSSATGTGGGGAVSVAGGSCSSGSFHNLPPHSISSIYHHQSTGLGAVASSHLSIDPASYGNFATKDFRYVHGSKTSLEERGLYSDAPASARLLSMDSSFDTSWRLLPSPATASPSSKDKDGSFLHGNYSQFQPLQQLGQVTISSFPKPNHHQHQHSFFGSDYGSAESPIKTDQPLRPFFDEWPGTRDSWSDLEDDRSNRNSFSTTQLSISIPMSSSDFSTTSSRSQNDD